MVKMVKMMLTMGNPQPSPKLKISFLFGCSSQTRCRWVQVVKFGKKGDDFVLKV
jgi:hypothetical protein